MAKQAVKELAGKVLGLRVISTLVSRGIGEVLQCLKGGYDMA